MNVKCPDCGEYNSGVYLDDTGYFFNRCGHAIPQDQETQKVKEPKGVSDLNATIEE